MDYEVEKKFSELMKFVFDVIGISDPIEFLDTQIDFFTKIKNSNNQKQVTQFTIDCADIFNDII